MPDSDQIPTPPPGADHAETAAGELDRALDLIRFLRANCPWDAKQTHASLVPHLLEESHEVADAIHAEDAVALEGELGDLLLNLAFQIVVGEEAGSLTANSVTRRIEEKMRRRHPHLYGIGPKRPWEEIKAEERAESGEAEGGVLSGIPGALDPLNKSYRVQERVASVGFDWESPAGAMSKVAEELEEVRAELDAGVPDAAHLEEEVGDLLFAVVNLSRLAGVHPVSALERANRKFTGRFVALEKAAEESGIVVGEATLEELDQLWDQIKMAERVEGQ